MQIRVDFAMEMTGKYAMDVWYYQPHHANQNLQCPEKSITHRMESQTGSSDA